MNVVVEPVDTTRQRVFVYADEDIEEPVAILTITHYPGREVVVAGRDGQMRLIEYLRIQEA